MRKKSSAKKLYIFLGLFLALGIFIGGFFLWWNAALSPLNKSAKQTSIFVVERGAGIKAIGAELQKAGFIRNSFVFYLYVKQQHLENSIQAGDFRLSPSYPLSQIVSIMTKGTLDVWVTIPEGKRADEIAAILQTNLPSYTDAWRIELEAHEGYLFPDTYLVPRDATIESVISLLTNTFEAKYTEATAKKTTSLSKADTIIIASMIEREAKLPEDRAKIASVMINRLDIDMALQIDSTIQYAIGTSKKWWPTLQESPKFLVPNSAYNTYTHPGLPPTPISNPGVAALTAAANPDKTNYLYYYTDTSGVTHYATTLDGHEANIQKYH
jgi:UPF0755 protein